MGEPVIKKAINVLDMLSRDPETVRLAELRMKQLLDERSMVEGAKEEGIEIGEDRRAIRIAVKMLNRGDDISDIIDVTELPEKRILELKEELIKNK
jgi:predicted transposase/invertase (TIGR01784 family)